MKKHIPKRLAAFLLGAICCLPQAVPVSAANNSLNSIITKSVSIPIRPDGSLLGYETLSSSPAAGSRDYLYKAKNRTKTDIPVYYYRPDINNIIDIHYLITSDQYLRKTVQITDFSLLEENSKTLAKRNLTNNRLACLTKNVSGKEYTYHYLAFNTDFKVDTTSAGISNLFRGGTITRNTDSLEENLKFSLNATEVQHNVALKYTPSSAMSGPAMTLKSRSENKDGENAFYIIPDKEAPVISGANIFTDITNGDVEWTDTEPIHAIINITDDSSGVKDGSIVITNRDNGKSKSFPFTGNNPTVDISLDMTDNLYDGICDIIITAYDNVGNKREESYVLNYLNLKTWIESNFKPYDNTFWTGEDGTLYVYPTGYAESLEITFPAGITPMYYIYENETEKHYESMVDGEERLPQTFTIDYTGRRKSSRLDKVIFKVEDSEALVGSYFKVKVTAKKNTKSITIYPGLNVIGYSGDYSHTRIQ